MGAASARIFPDAAALRRRERPAHDSQLPSTPLPSHELQSARCRFHAKAGTAGPAWFAAALGDQQVQTTGRGSGFWRLPNAEFALLPGSRVVPTGAPGPGFGVVAVDGPGGLFGPFAERPEQLIGDLPDPSRRSITTSTGRAAREPSPWFAARRLTAAYKGEPVGHEDHDAVDALVGGHAFVELGDDAITLVLWVCHPATEEHVVDQEQPSGQ
jgi:hypothetical protein